MNRIALPIVLVGCGIAAGLAIASGPAEPTPAGGPDMENLAVLRKERCETLREALNLAERGYRTGIFPYSSVSRITLNWLNAELDAAPDRAGRIAVRKRIVLQLKHMEETAAEQAKAGLAQSTDLLEAKAARLQSEIELLREKAEN